MDAEARDQRTRFVAFLRQLAVWGPGLLVMLADMDAGNVVAASQGGAQWGCRLLPLLLLLIPVLYIVQELTVRLGVHTGRGHGELIRERFGAGWAWLSLAGLSAAAIGSLVTEFTAVAGIGELFGVAREVSLPVAAVALLLIVGTGSYRRVERVALAVGLLELAFFAVVWVAHPDFGSLVSDAADQPVGNAGFAYLAAAIIGATFNPWMIFYQQSATVDKRLQPDDLKSARWDTGVGAVLTQCLAAAVLVAAAATLRSGGAPASLDSVGEISDALTPLLGPQVGQVVFGVGVLGASFVAAIVASLALTWGVGEVTGRRRSLEYRPFEARWFLGVYAACIIGVAILVGWVPDLVWLTITAQVANAFLMPLVIGLLVALVIRVLPESHRPSKAYLCLAVASTALVSGLGLIGGLAGLF